MLSQATRGPLKLVNQDNAYIGPTMNVPIINALLLQNNYQNLTANSKINNEICVGGGVIGNYS